MTDQVFAVLYDDETGTHRVNDQLYADSYEAAADAREFSLENPGARNVRVVHAYEADSYE